MVSNEAKCDCGDSLCKGSLGFHRGQDPNLYDLYARKLLKRGWAGVHTAEEISFTRIAKPPSEARIENGKRLAALRKSIPQG